MRSFVRTFLSRDLPWNTQFKPKARGVDYAKPTIDVRSTCRNLPLDEGCCVDPASQPSQE